MLPCSKFLPENVLTGTFRQRPLSACACPNAIAAFEGRYFASAHRDGQPGTRMAEPDDVDVKSERIAESHSHQGSSEADADDRHLNDIPSDDSAWDEDGQDDCEGRSQRRRQG